MHTQHTHARARCNHRFVWMSRVAIAIHRNAWCAGCGSAGEEAQFPRAEWSFSGSGLCVPSELSHATNWVGPRQRHQYPAAVACARSRLVYIRSSSSVCMSVCVFCADNSFQVRGSNSRPSERAYDRARSAIRRSGGSAVYLINNVHVIPEWPNGAQLCKSTAHDKN